MATAVQRNPEELWGGLTIAIGAAGVVLTSALYALSPPAAALPVPNPAMPEAFEAAASGVAMMWAAGTVGVISDIILAAGALLLAAASSGSALERLGWAAAAVTATVFIFVDTIVGHVLPQLAALPGGEIAFVGFKRLFDALFAFGTIAFGASSVAIFLTRSGRAFLGNIGALVGAAGIVIGLVHFAGFDVGQPTGIFIALASILLALLGIRIARRGRGAVPSIATASA